MIAAIVDDLIFSSKIREVTNRKSLELTTFRNIDKFKEALSSNSYDLLLVDLHAKRIDPNLCIQSFKENQNSKVVCFFSHMDKERAVKAKECGADLVLPRSQFVVELENIIAS